MKASSSFLGKQATVALPEFIKVLVEKKLGEYCNNRVPVHLHNKLNVTFETRANNITIYENRAPWRSDLTEWTKIKVAQIRYDEKKAMWKLYCRDQYGKWHLYEPLPAMKDLDRIIEEIETDPTGIFWG